MSTEQQPEDDGLMRLNLTDQQKFLLSQTLGSEMVKLASLKFEDPAEDARMARYSAYLHGGKEMLEYLLGFDKKLDEQMEAEKQLRLDAQNPAGSNIPDFPTF